MRDTLRWRDHFGVNLLWLGVNTEIGSITPIILPYLVAAFVADSQKNTSLAAIRVVSLAVAMLVQPVAGLLSDRSRHTWGRRRPYILMGTCLNLIFLLIIGFSPSFIDSQLDQSLEPLLGVSSAYLVLFLGIVLVQASVNVIMGGLIGLLPDLVPEDQRGRSSGLKSVLELAPAFLIIFIGPWVDDGHLWPVIGIIMGILTVTMLITILLVDEQPLENTPTDDLGEHLRRLVGLTAIFVIATQVAVWLVTSAGSYLLERQADLWQQIGLVGLAGLVGMAGSIFIGVYAGARVGIGAEAQARKSFIWWIVNRLLFLAAVGSIQGFAFFYLQDYLKVQDPASLTTILLAFVGAFLIPSALGGGYLADRFGRKRLVQYAGLIAALGNIVLLLATSFPLAVVSGCIIGAGAGLFWATSWALGTDLIPSGEGGRYLGISNLAGAGAGIVGVGIGGPIADFFNAVQVGLGYQVIFSLYAFLFLLSIIVLRKVQPPMKVPDPG